MLKVASYKIGIVLSLFVLSLYPHIVFAKTSDYLLGKLSLSQSQFLSPDEAANKSQSYSRAAVQLHLSDQIARKNQHQPNYLADFRFQTNYGEITEQSIAVPELYVHVGSADKVFQFDLGRKLTTWSAYDEFWGFGTWQPTLKWEDVWSEQQGLTGLFGNLNVQYLHLTGFVSGVYLPSQAGTVTVEDGKVVSGDRWFNDPVGNIIFADRSSEIYYELEDIDNQDFISQWSYGFQFVLGDVEDEGWLRVATASKPMNQIYFSVEGKQDLSAANLGVLPTNVVIHPMVVRHQVTTFESGYSGKTMNMWASVTRDRPYDTVINPRWEKLPLPTTTLFGVYLSYKWRWRGEIFTGYSNKFDDVSTDTSSSLINSDTKNSYHRIPFDEVWSLGWRSRKTLKNMRGIQHPWSLSLKYMYAPTDQGAMLNTKLDYQFTAKMQFFVAADIVGSEQTSGNNYFYRNQANDQILGGFSYAL